ncbi:hypothetical protein R1sor_003877 [Riccia sorocarpa]|uniref:MMS19 nucleotide excision repair protein n=1 Tax=Riccia sorocarpa TaxID=122646 RepID=A0ABD3H692_9MARC
MAGSSSWVAHIDSFVDPDAPESKQAASRDVISKLLLNGTITLQQLVVVAGKYLTSSDNVIRARGLTLLAELLDNLVDKPLEHTAIHSLATFFSDRLKDWHSLRPALIGSVALLRRQKRVGAVQPEDVVRIAKLAVHELEVQALSQKDRMLSLELYECLLFLHGSSVKQLGDELVLGITAAIDGEKDPRNILMAFRLVEQLVALFPEPDGPVNESAETIFAILSCYFPITYNPPPDQRGIKREDLSSALLKAFASTAWFAPFCFPEFLEKLSSSLPSAKLDALRYMGHCALSFGPEVMSAFSEDIWFSLKSEMFRLEEGDLEPKDMQIREEAYSCFTHCIEISQKRRTIGGQEATGDLLTLVLEDADMLDFLGRVKNDVEQRKQSDSGEISVDFSADGKVKALGRVLGAGARASTIACYRVTKKYFSYLVPSVGSAPHCSGSGQSVEANIPLVGLGATLHILEGANHMAHSLADLHQPLDDSTGRRWLEPITEAAPFLIRSFTQLAVGGVAKTEYSKAGVAGLQTLATFPAGLSPISEEQLENLLTFFTVSFLDKSRGSEVKDEALGAILTASDLEEKSSSLTVDEPPRKRGKVDVQHIVIPKLLEAVRDSQSAELLKTLLHALAALSKHRAAVRLTVLKALGDDISSKLGRKLVSADRGFELDRMILILRNLSADIIPFCEVGSIDQRAASDLVMDVWRTFGSLSDASLYSATDIFPPLMTLFRITVQKCPETLQRMILSEGLSVLKKKSSAHIKTDNVRQASSNEGLEGEHWYVALVSSVVVALLPSVFLEEKETLLRLFVNTSIANVDPVITQVAAQAAASLLNKWQDDKSGNGQGGVCTLDEAIVIAVDEGWMPRVEMVLAENGSYPENAEKVAVRSIYALALAGKGLAMRGHSFVSEIAGVMLRLLTAKSTASKRDKPNGVDSEERLNEASRSAVAKAAVESFGIIVKDHSTFLSKSQNAVIRPLYKQRFFTSMLTPLVEALRLVGSQPSRIWFHRAFASLLSGTPLAAALTEGQKVFPLILEGLSTLSVYPEDSDFLLQMLLALSSFLVDESHGRSIAAEYVQSMVTRLIPLVQYKPSMVIRESALQCLAAIVGLPFTRVFPVKAQVMKVITSALDDNKRLVRKEAVRCRQVWSAISSK